jgi:hypothetical protein
VFFEKEKNVLGKGGGGISWQRGALASATTAHPGRNENMKTTNSVFVGHMNKQASGNAKERSMTGGWNRCSSLLCSFFVCKSSSPLAVLHSFEICGLRGRAGTSFSRLVIGTIGNRKNFISLSIISVPKIVMLYHTHPVTALYPRARAQFVSRL